MKTSAFELAEFNSRIQRIVGNDRSGWEQKYKLVFTKEHRDFLKDYHLDYADPDTTYKEDVLAFTRALNEYTKSYTEKIDVTEVEQEVRVILGRYENGNAPGAHADEDNLLAMLVMATAGGHENAPELCRAALPLLEANRRRWYE